MWIFFVAMKRFIAVKECIQGDSQICLEKKPVTGDDERKP
jgi:hypothetical protein